MPPLSPEDVTELSGDGSEKVLVKLCPETAPLRRAGRPPQRQKRKPYSNGWFLITDPKTGRILGVEYMHEPEITEIKFNRL